MNGFSALLQDAAARHGDRPALVEGERSVRYGELPELLGRIADSWQLPSTPRIALLLDNGVDAVLADLAGRWSAATVASIPPFFTPEQRSRALEDLAPDLILLPTAQAAVWPGEAKPCLGLESTSALKTESHRSRLPQAESSSACISYTSGSTGEPKGVALDESLLLRLVALLATYYRERPGLEENPATGRR